MASKEDTQTFRLGRTIRYRRKQLGMTQEELAEKLGVGHQALSRIEQGHMAPKMDRLPLIATCLQCNVSDLFREKTDTSADYASRIEDLMTGLSPKKREYLYQHISGLVFMLKMVD